MRHLPVLIVICPLIASQLCLLLSRKSIKLGRYTLMTAAAASLVMSVMQLFNVIEFGTIHYEFGNYSMPLGIEFVIDTINALLLILISLIGLMTIIFSTKYEKIDVSNAKTVIATSNTMLGILLTGLLGMTSTGDVFNLYVFLELTSLSAYCLIALGGSKGVISAYRYMLVGTVAATFYLLGVAVLYSVTGTLNMADMAAILNEGEHDEAMLIALCLLVVAFGIKMALFPFHGWQPSAYTHADASARPFIAGVMGKVPAYAMFRYLYCIYGTDFRYFRHILLIIGIFSVCGMLYGSIRAMSQVDLRKVLAYSSVAQIGYIGLGFAIGTPIALAGAFLHMIGHAFMKGGLFYGTAAIWERYRIYNINDLGRIYKEMPWTAGLITVASLSMVGIPPTVGFFSKWYLGTAAAAAGEWFYLAILVISSLLNAVYFFKLIEKIFVNSPSTRVEHGNFGKLEIYRSMLIPIALCFIAIILLGVFNVKIVDILLISLKGVAL